jgi:hypothetical protein
LGEPGGAEFPLTETEADRWSRLWLEAQLELADTKDERIAAYKEHLERTRSREIASTYPQYIAAHDCFVSQPELWLERAKTAPDAK